MHKGNHPSLGAKILHLHSIPVSTKAFDMQLTARQDILVMAGLSYAVSLSSCLSNFQMRISKLYGRHMSTSSMQVA